MAFDQDKFELRFPELAGHDDALLEVLYEDAICLIGDQANWCDGKYPVALQYLMAHLLATRLGAMASGGGGGATNGPITSKSAKGVSVSYASSTEGLSLDDKFYISTEYGKFYSQLRRQCFTGMGVTVAHCPIGLDGTFAAGNFFNRFYRY